ncbi:hypothetical protein GON01_03480 [Sphingomonas sp. MAH-20]|uniref:Uncharacterized protein n=1 Tax=Sphingomonas horti TaxID=2682842 RepID=A0A6I4IXV8_9SPHN|nr:hypothetical protein [Sphingomonas sp. CGMCC 1.13658]MVO76999.1 hypothetical protein [Sphingomonas horti]
MPTLSRHHQVIIDLSIRILRHAMTRAGEGRVDTIEVRLALRCLLHHCPDRWPLELFWDAAKGDNDIGRAQGTTAAFNGIIRQLRLAGKYQD